MALRLLALFLILVGGYCCLGRKIKSGDCYYLQTQFAGFYFQRTPPKGWEWGNTGWGDGGGNTFAEIRRTNKV